MPVGTDPPEAVETELVTALRSQERAWDERPLTRSLYEDWYREIRALLADVPGVSVELGAGIGTLHAVCTDVVPTDVEPTPWTDSIVDAEHLPYDAGTIANLVLVDVYHHLPRPAVFLSEAVRALATGGRIVVLDPYCSPVSTWAYRRFHHERTDLGADPFADDRAIAATPLESNQARATLSFFRAADELERRWPELRLVERRRLALFAYPLSGGLTGRRLVPVSVGKLIQRAEGLLGILAPLLATRCLVVLERR